MGVSVEAPGGWEVSIDAGAHRPSRTETNGRSDLGRARVRAPVGMGDAKARIHAANFALPAQRGDFGSGAVDRMGAGDVLVCILEEDPAVAGTALYANDGVPRFTAADFDPNRMQRPTRGQSGAQAFFRVGSRAFVAYVVMGDHQRRAGLVGQVNRVMASIRLD